MVSGLAIILGAGLLLFLFVPNIKEKVTQSLSTIQIPKASAQVQTSRIFQPSGQTPTLSSFLSPQTGIVDSFLNVTGTKEFFERVAAIQSGTQSGQFIQELDAEGRPIRSI